MTAGLQRFGRTLISLLTLAGLVLLALANDREGKLLLRRIPARWLKRVFRLLGYLMLALALWVCVLGWRGNFGPFLWFGWLTVAALVWVFAIAYWPWREKQPQRKPRAPRGKAQNTVDHATSAEATPTLSTSTGMALWHRGWHTVLALLLIAIPLGFVAAVYQAPVHPLLRADALQGQVGPWTFTLVEEEQPPRKTRPAAFWSST